MAKKEISTAGRLTRDREKRARILAEFGCVTKAIASGRLPQYSDVTLSEALVIGLFRQGVKKFFVVFGHGSTEIGEVLRIYAGAGAVEVYPVRSEIEASHAATALRWAAGEKSAVITSIGPGALQAMAASLVGLSDAVGVYYIFGDETTQDEGFNMQQIPRSEQGLFLRLFSTMSDAYSLYDPLSLHTALMRGLTATNDPVRQRPFYLLAPMNRQGETLAGFNLDELPWGSPPKVAACDDEEALAEAAEALIKAKRVVIRAGGGSREAGDELIALAELADGVIITSPIATGVVPYNYERNMTVAGSKGSICGNFAMETADLLVAVGSRSVCQSDSSRTAYPNVKRVININADGRDAQHYNKTIALVGDAKGTLAKMNEAIAARLGDKQKVKGKSKWFAECEKKKKEWTAFKRARFDAPVLFDEKRGEKLLTQPAAVKIAADFARERDIACFFDAGDVQANGFQIVEDERVGLTFTDTGASYMGFAASALLATGVADRAFYAFAFTGDGSFMMNPQILIDAAEHGASGCVLLFDNRRMAAISSLQKAQYGTDFATDDSVEVDYVALAGAVKGVNAIFGGKTPEEFKAALEKAYEYGGLSVIHVPVYFGDDPLGGLGAYGRWNVGSWCEDTQALRHKIGL